MVGLHEYLCNNTANTAQFNEFTKHFQYKFTLCHAPNALAAGAPDPAGEAHDALPDPLVGFRMPVGNA